MKSNIKMKIAIAFILPFIILILLGYFLYQTSLHTKEYIYWATHTFEVREQIAEIRANMNNIDREERGYLITGDDKYLKSYNSELSLIQPNIDNIRQLTMDNPIQEKNLDILESLIKEREEELKQEIHLRQTQGFNENKFRALTEIDLNKMDNILKVLEDMLNEEAHLLKERMTNQQLSLSKLNDISTVGVLLTFIFSMITSFLFYKADKDRDALERINTKIRISESELRCSNEELEQFAYVASHDLQTPLRHITSYVQLLIAKIEETTKVDEQMKKWIQYITSGTLQMKTLIDDLLSYSRVGEVNVEEVNVTKVIEKVSEMLQEPIRETNAEIIYEKLPVVLGTKTQLHQLFQNLIGNALKFKKPNLAPVVNIRCEEQGAFWKFYVSDNGIGFDPKYSTRIFTMFKRLHTSNEYPGTGIGLTICKKIVESHGGEIGVDSAEGKGSTFFFTLPKKMT